jgi:hypothetical protein
MRVVKVHAPFAMNVTRRSTGMVYRLAALRLSWSHICNRRNGHAIPTLWKYIACQFMYEMSNGELSRHRPHHRPWE